MGKDLVHPYIQSTTILCDTTVPCNNMISFLSKANMRMISGRLERQFVLGEHDSKTTYTRKKKFELKSEGYRDGIKRKETR